MSEQPSFDWNLTRNLDALLCEGNVTRAAARVGITQSAMSRALSRLRVVFEDELFVRTKSGIEPTPKAIALAPKIRDLCERMGDLVLSTDSFEPTTAERTFTVVSADYSEWLVMPPLMMLLQEQAPGISVVFRRAVGSASEYLHNSEIDLALAPEGRDLGTLQSNPLFREEFCCIVRSEHPRLGGKKRLTLEAFCREAHVLIAPRGQAGGVVDRLLRERNKSRRVAARVPSFLVAPEVVAGTDLIATVPRRLAAANAARLNLRILPPPIEVPGFTMLKIWHPRNSGDAAHQFLRDAVSAVFQ